MTYKKRKSPFDLIRDLTIEDWNKIINNGYMKK
jgi:hypothetical protein